MKAATEWLTILGVPQDLNKRVRVCLDAVEAIREGREPPKRAALPAERAVPNSLRLLSLPQSSRPNRPNRANPVRTARFTLGGFFPGNRSRGQGDRIGLMDAAIGLVRFGGLPRRRKG